MRGLAFPSNAVFDREVSYDRDTPNNNNINVIPIDPALSGTPIDPAITGEGSRINRAQDEIHTIYQEAQSIQFRQHSHEPRQYSQGPQGDPFAPQPVQYLAVVEEDQPVPSPKAMKRKRKPKREQECGFCQGSDAANKDGQPEIMVSCGECGRSGHPSCMELAEVGEVVRSYPWRCIECKICEVCQEKGDDERILFCDFCDRGWHMDCLQPPLEESPPGRWHCPICPPLVQDGIDYYTATEREMQAVSEDGYEEITAGPSSRRRSTKSNNRRGKRKAATSDEDSEVDMDNSDGEEMEVALKRRHKKSTKKGSARQDSDDEEPSSPAPFKRPRIRLTSNNTSRPRIRLRIPAKGKKEEDEGPPKGLFDDILGREDKDTTKTTVDNSDKQRFEKSRLAAEEKIVPPPAPLASDYLDTPIGSSLYRPLRSSALHQILIPSSTPGMSASPAPSTPGPFSMPTGSAPGLRIQSIRFGEYDIKTWYDAPFPEEYANISDGRLWICEFCLKYMKSRFGAVRHRMKCKARHPPGDEIYRDGAVSVFEVDGRKNKIYCQNLCLLSKMFLDHKSLFYDVEPFLFYVMTEVDDAGARFVGYFSKEKRSPKDYNVSCIMTLPVRQRKGWGNLLIDFSYLLSKKEQRTGSPEKPLSGLGALGYKNYWTLALMRYLDLAPLNPRLEDISVATSMTIEDIHTTLMQQNMIFSREFTPPPIRPSPGQSIKFPKGRKHGVARRHLQRTQTNDDADAAPQAPFSAPIQYEIRWNRDNVLQYLVNWEAKGYLKLKAEKLKWSPFLLARMKKTEGLQSVAAPEKSVKVDPITVDHIPITVVDGPSTTSHNGFRYPSGSLFHDDAEAFSSHHPDAQDIPRIEDETLPLFEQPEEAETLDNSKSPTASPTGSALKRGRGRPKGSRTHLNGEVTPQSNLGRGQRHRRTNDTDHSLADDEALAAKLAMEERRPTRSLRTRAEPTPDQARSSSVELEASKSASQQKRGRVEPSPETERAESSNPVNGGITRGFSGSMSPRDLRRTSRNGNGSGGDIDSSHTIPLTSRMNKVSISSPSPLSPAVTKPKLTAGNGMVTEVKAEVFSTPISSTVSRQSEPSDDTAVAAEATTEKQANGHHTDAVDIDADEDADGEEDLEADEDAEWEEDLDAEGEIDADGDAEMEITF